MWQQKWMRGLRYFAWLTGNKVYWLTFSQYLSMMGFRWVSLGFVGFRSAITTNSKVLTGASKWRRQPRIRWSDFLSLISLAMCVSLLKWNSSAANGMMLSSLLLGYSKRVNVRCYCHKRWLDFNLYILAFQTPAWVTAKHTRITSRRLDCFESRHKSMNKSSLSSDENTKHSTAVSGWMTIMSNGKARGLFLKHFYRTRSPLFPFHRFLFLPPCHRRKKQWSQIPL